MSLDKASMVITGSILPIEIQKKFTGGTFEYDLANDTEGYYYKLTDITTSSTDLIDTGVNYMQFGGSNQGADAGTAMHTTAATDKVKFLYIKHTGEEDDGTTDNSDSIYICFDGGTAANDLSDALEIGDGETFFCKPGCTIADIHCIAGQANKGGAASNKIQAIVIAILDNV